MTFTFAASDHAISADSEAPSTDIVLHTSNKVRLNSLLPRYYPNHSQLVRIAQPNRVQSYITRLRPLDESPYSMDNLNQAELFVTHLSQLNDQERNVKAKLDARINAVEIARKALADAHVDLQQREGEYRAEIEHINEQRQVRSRLHIDD